MPVLLAKYPTTFVRPKPFAVPTTVTMPPISTRTSATARPILALRDFIVHLLEPAATVRVPAAQPVPPAQVGTALGLDLPTRAAPAAARRVAARAPAREPGSSPAPATPRRARRTDDRSGCR